MNNLEFFFTILAIIQIIHSVEEMVTHFEKRWPLWKMSRKTFIIFEMCLSTLLVLVILSREFPYRIIFMIGFNLLMFANGIWHLFWAWAEKKYVPGLLTAPLFIIIFLVFYFQLFKL